MPKYKITVEGGDLARPLVFNVDNVDTLAERALEPHYKQGEFKPDRYEPKGMRITIKGWTGGEGDWDRCAGTLPDVIDG